MFPEPARAMALIREPGCKCDFGQQQVRACEKVLRTAHAAVHQIIVRGQTLRLLEGASEVVHRQPNDSGQRLYADGLFEVILDIFAHPSQRSGRQAAANARMQLRENGGCVQ